MSKIINDGNQVVPLREDRVLAVQSIANGASMAEFDISGDPYTMINVVGISPVMTLTISGSIDGSIFFPIFCVPISATLGNVPNFALALTAEPLVAATTHRAYVCDTAALRKIRVAPTAYTSGVVNVSARSAPEAGGHLECARYASPLFVTATGAAGAAVTATLPASVGLRHRITRIDILRSASAALTAGAAPVLTTSANLPGAYSLSFGSDAAPQGSDRWFNCDLSGAPIVANAANTASSITCPVTTGVIWRINVHFGLQL